MKNEGKSVLTGKKDFLKWITGKVRSVQTVLFGHVILEPMHYLIKILTSAIGFEQLAKGLIDLNITYLIRGGLIYVSGIIFSAIINGIDVYMEKRIENDLYVNLKKEILNCLLNRKIKEKQMVHSGKLLDTCTKDVDIFVDFMGMKITDMITPVFVCGISILLVISKSPLIAGAVLGTLVFSFALNLYFLPRYGMINQKIRKREEQLTVGFLEEVRGNAIIRVFTYQKDYLKHIAELTQRVFEENDKEVRTRFVHGVLVNFLAFSSMTIPFVIGALVVLKGGLRVEELMYITQISGNLLWFVDIMAQAVVSIQKARVSAERIYGIVSREQEPVSEQMVPVSLENAISITNMSVEYGEKEVLSDISLTIPQGAYIAFVGESGSGKSTIFKALDQLTPYTGAVRLFGQDVKKYSEKAIRKLFSYAFQDTMILNGNLLENIQFGNEGLSEKKIMELIHMTCLEYLIGDESSLRADIGEAGNKLSGGEKQRIAVIRAILRESPILLFDEATSALDKENEEIVMKCIESLRCEKTILVAAQKIKTIQNADRIYVVKNGRIVEMGSHAELVAKNGEYTRLCTYGEE